MIKHGELNSRMKDFYDIWTISRKFEFQSDRLTEAIRLTFERRGRIIPDYIVAFSKEFASEKQNQWKAFSNKLRDENIPDSFAEIVSAIKIFLFPILNHIAKNNKH